MTDKTGNQGVLHLAVVESGSPNPSLSITDLVQETHLKQILYDLSGACLCKKLSTQLVRRTVPVPVAKTTIPLFTLLLPCRSAGTSVATSRR